MSSVDYKAEGINTVNKLALMARAPHLRGFGP